MTRPIVKAAFAFFLVITLLLVSGSTVADTVYLKNGMYVVVTKTEEKNGILKYWIGDDEYEGPKPDVLNRAGKRACARPTHQIACRQHAWHNPGPDAPRNDGAKLRFDTRKTEHTSTHRSKTE